MSGEISMDALRAYFARAIEACNEAWRERWERAPTLNELTHPFGVVLGASPASYVRDADTIARAHRAEPIPMNDASRFSVRFWNADELQLERWSVELDGVGVLSCVADRRDSELRVEYERSSGWTIPDRDAARLITMLVARAFMERHRVPIHSVTACPTDSLGDPIRIEAAREP